MAETNKSKESERPQATLRELAAEVWDFVVTRGRKPGRPPTLFKLIGIDPQSDKSAQDILTKMERLSPDEVDEVRASVSGAPAKKKVKDQNGTPTTDNVDSLLSKLMNYDASADPGSAPNTGSAPKSGSGPGPASAIKPGSAPGASPGLKSGGSAAAPKPGSGPAPGPAQGSGGNPAPAAGGDPSRRMGSSSGMTDKAIPSYPATAGRITKPSHSLPPLSKDPPGTRDQNVSTGSQQPTAPASAKEHNITTIKQPSGALPSAGSRELPPSQPNITSIRPTSGPQQPPRDAAQQARDSNITTIRGPSSQQPPQGRDQANPPNRPPGGQPGPPGQGIRPPNAQQGAPGGNGAPRATASQATTPREMASNGGLPRRPSGQEQHRLGTYGISISINGAATNTNQGRVKMVHEALVRYLQTGCRTSKSSVIFYLEGSGLSHLGQQMEEHPASVVNSLMALELKLADAMGLASALAPPQLIAAATARRADA